MKIITVINDTNDFGFNLLRLSCALNNLQLVVLVSGKDFNSNRIKDELLEDYLSETDDGEIVLFTDGNDAVVIAQEDEILGKFNKMNSDLNDAVVIAQEDEILGKFNKMNSDLVFSAEMTCWPDLTLAEQHPHISSSPYKYLNSGGFIGKVGYIKQLLKDVDVDTSSFKRSNQYIWMQRYFKNSHKMYLDTNCEIFSTFTPQMLFPQSQEHFPQYFALIDEWFYANFVIENSRIFNKATNTWPCHAHFNGFSKTLISRYIVDMIYEKTSSGNKIQFFYAEE